MQTSWKMSSLSVATVGAMIMAAGCGTAPALLTQDTEPSLAQLFKADDLFGDNGLVTLDAKTRAKDAPEADKPNPEDDLSPNDPEDLKKDFDCASLDRPIANHTVELNQSPAWHALLQTPGHQAFRALSAACNAKDCHAELGDEGGDKGKEDKGDKADKEDKFLLEYDCDVLTKKLLKAWDMVKVAPEFGAVRGSIEWQRLLADYDTLTAAECDKK